MYFIHAYLQRIHPVSLAVERVHQMHREVAAGVEVVRCEPTMRAQNKVWTEQGSHAYVIGCSITRSHLNFMNSRRVVRHFCSGFPLQYNAER